MKALFLRFSVAALCFAAALPAQTPKRIYVEPFATKTESEALRTDLIAEMKKLGNVALAMNEESADVVLGGAGEVWIRGYRSLNPRSGRSPANGTPVYAGYLAVELRNVRGETLWSDLVTPSEQSTDIAKQLAKEISKHVEGALSRGLPAGSPEAPPSAARVTLAGAGATFPFPLYTKWISSYQRVNPAVSIHYDSVGSETGVRRLIAGEVDFGASDNPEAPAKMAPQGNYLLFPTAVGAVVPIVNLPGITGDVQFTPEILAGIFLGKITKWNDQALRAANPRMRMPDLNILVVHRADGSGTSYAWTDYLSKVSPEWKQKAGASMTPEWPVGRAATGNDGVAGLVKEMGGSIGYVEFIYALRNHLSFGKVRNQNGEYVGASLESIGVAAKQSAGASDDLRISLVNAPGAGAYPIASFTWLVVPAHMADAAKRDAMTGFLRWMLGPGQTEAAALGYLALPKDLIARETEALGRIR